jgi:hypothetical protein
MDAEPGERPRTVIAVTNESSEADRDADDRHDHDMVRRRAAELGGAGATIILFPEGDPGPLASPLPTDWSADGEEDLFGKRLDPRSLEAAGRHELAEQVGALRSAGVDAYGWLPDHASASTLMSYAREQRADLILVADSDIELRDKLAEEEQGSAIAVEAVAPQER